MFFHFNGPVLFNKFHSQKFYARVFPQTAKAVYVANLYLYLMLNPF